MPIQNQLTIRDETPNDAREVRAVNAAAFGRDDEADLVEALHQEGAVLASFVAVLQNHIVGHVLFTRMWIDAARGPVEAVALAPVAVLPGHQRRGFGSRLIQLGLKRLRERDERIVIVLGDPKYYARFGCSVSKASTLQSPFPAEQYMALELVPGALDGIRGAVRYPAAFGL